MIELFHYPKSTCSQKVRLCLFEKGLDFENNFIDLSIGQHLTPEYLALNPNGVVPTLRHKGQTIHDSSVIMEYLDEIFPEVPMSGRTALDRAHVRTWLRFFEEVPTVAIRIHSFAQILLKSQEHLTPEAKRENSDKRTLRKGFYRSMENGISEERHAEAIDRLDMTLRRMEVTLSNQEWLSGDHFSLAEACVVPTIDRMENLGLSSHWLNLPGVTLWWEQIKKRESYKMTYAPGSRLLDIAAPDIN